MDAHRKFGKEAEELTEKVRVFLTKIAEEAISETDEPGLLSGDEITSFVETTLFRLAIERRVGLHAAVWVSDVEVYAREITRMAMNGKLKKAASARDRAGREF